MGFSVAFDPFDCAMALVGGLIIAVASSFAYMVYGRITGLSGIFYGTISLQLDRNGIWRLGFLFGLILSAMIPSVFWPDGVTVAGKTILLFDSVKALESHLPKSVAVLAGALVGFGTKLGSGCTSGHGVCGLPRLSPRSFVAVACFMSIGVVVSTYVRPLLPAADLPPPLAKSGISVPDSIIFVVFLLAFKLSVIYYAMSNALVAIDIAVSAVLGCTFGVGLLLSGMGRQSKIFAFLTIAENWDPSLMFVMMGAVCFNLVTFQYAIRGLGKTLTGRPLPALPRIIDWKLVLGAAVFGVGWGLGGLCPGPAIVNLFRSSHILLFLLALAGGQVAAEKLTAPPSKVKGT